MYDCSHDNLHLLNNNDTAYLPIPYREKRYLPLSKFGMSRRINLQNTNITKISWIYNLETKITAELKDKV